MNAIQFIKEHGVDKAREVVDNHHECYMPEVFKYWSEQLQDYVLAPKYASFLVSDLKRLIESVDLINSLGGVQEATNKAFDMTMLVVGFNPDKIEQAIADYDSIYGGEHV